MQHKQAISARWLAVMFAAALIAAAGPVAAAPAAERWALWDKATDSSMVIDHSAWQALLDRYVSPAGDGVNRVNYAGFSASDRAALQGYIEQLQALDPRIYNRAEQMAFWINLYNALTVDVVLRYPSKASILRMGKKLFTTGPWDDNVARVQGINLTLNDIEHRILRPIFTDHRVHFAVNCASLGCPNLALQAYSGANLEQALALVELEYINHPRGVRVSRGGKLELSSIFDWYRSDFAASERALLDYLAARHRTAGELLRNYPGELSYTYDWSLNTAAKP